MIKLCANLGFLWTELTLPDAIRAAKSNGFHAVECHWPYDTLHSDLTAALDETGLKMLGLNTRRGDVASGENGVAALVGRETEAREFIDESINYARAIGCDNIHVMAGVADPMNNEAQGTFTDNLKYGCKAAAVHGKTVLIEPLNKYDAPGYFLSTLDAALETIDRVAEPNLKIMFDCYHMQIMGGDLLRRYKQTADKIGHVQFASVPDRAEPDSGEIDCRWLLGEIAAAGYTGMFGAEYKPRTTTDAGIGWIKEWVGTS